MPLSICEHVPLRELTTFRTGGPARYFCAVTSEAELAEAVAWVRARVAAGSGSGGKRALPFFILGGGSNVLVDDGGFEGLVIRMEIKMEIEVWRAGIFLDTPQEASQESPQNTLQDTRQEESLKHNKVKFAIQQDRPRAKLKKAGDFSEKIPKKWLYSSCSGVQFSEKFQLSENIREVKNETIGKVQKKENDSNGRMEVTAGAGENWDDFVGACVERGFHGLENLSGIPGTVGAAPVQNIGAYGAEVSQTISSVRVFDTQTEKYADFSNADCRFRYRDSIFKYEKNENGTPRYVITSVTFDLSTDASRLNISYKDLREYFNRSGMIITAKDVRAAVLAIRAAKLPDIRTVGTAGSFFKNPIISRRHFDELKAKYPDLPSFPAEPSVKIPLAWILDHVCGYKNMKKGAVGTYKNQALVIVNEGDASAREIRDFAADIAVTVKEKTGIVIEPEVQYVG